jgi:alpha-tubulin suppressor-like RCC1 family protein
MHWTGSGRRDTVYSSVGRSKVQLRTKWQTFAALGSCIACHADEPLSLPQRRPNASDLTALPPNERIPGPVQSLALGANYTCALLSAGSVKCWGSDENGVLGRDTAYEDIADPRLIGPIDFGTSRAVVALSAGWHHACVIFDDARARCWGRNDRGQLGQGNTEDYGDDPGETLNALSDLPLEHIVALAAGVSNTCAIVASAGAAGTVHCWGSDVGGAIGDSGSGDFGDDEVVDASRSVPLPEWANAIAAGDGVNCALLLDGSVRCWGSNAFGTRGIGNAACTSSADPGCSGSGELRPVQELGEQVVHSIQLNQAHACALDNRGDLRCWGRNDQSRAGYPEVRAGSTLFATPGPVELGAGVSVLSFGLGTRHGCALDTRGAIRCWGEAGPQLGYGMLQKDGSAGVGGTLTPAEQYGLRGDQGVVQLGPVGEAAENASALRVFSGGSHNCAILAEGRVRCWGHNESGQLGYGNFSQVGQIGEMRTPRVDYERLNQADVCVAPEPSRGCPAAVR